MISSKKISVRKRRRHSLMFFSLYCCNASLVRQARTNHRTKPHLPISTCKQIHRLIATFQSFPKPFLSTASDFTRSKFGSQSFSNSSSDRYSRGSFRTMEHYPRQCRAAIPAPANKSGLQFAHCDSPHRQQMLVLTRNGLRSCWPV